MTRFRRSLLGAAAVAGSALGIGAPATAADLFPPLVQGPAPHSAAPSVGAGWYLRGDLGYAAYRDPELRVEEAGLATALDGSSADGAIAIGVGAGYKFNTWLRADVTADHRFASQAQLFADPLDPTVRGYAEIASTAVLANAYLDLGTWGGFTPYVGGGIGWAFNQISNYGADCAAPCVVGGTNLETDFADATTGSFAYALMAGVAVDAGRSLTLDLNYRYLNLGEVRTESSGGASIDTDSLDAHEARIGLRWTFDDPAVGPHY